MDYYNLARFLKNVVYNFMRMFKYMSYCLVAVCFIAVCLLLMSSRSKAISVSLTETQAQTMINRLNSDQTYWYRQGNACYALFYYPQEIAIGSNSPVSASYFCFGWLPDSAVGEFIEEPQEFQMRWVKGTALQCGYWDENLNYLGCNSYWYNSGQIMQFPYTFFMYQLNQNNIIDHKLYIAGTSTVVTPSLVNDDFVAPYLLPNASEEQSQQDALTSGQFTFFIVNPRYFR